MNKTVSLKRVNTLSSVANVGASEDQLDAAIYYCLNVLTKKHLPSDQFRSVFSKGMFLKPNTKAFIHVMHFLFNVHDAKEFRKRFYWPIFDKNAESAFRSSTVEYVNSLVDRGKLDMEKIKAHTVVLPGGLKFMKFLLILIKFVIKEELKRSGVNSGGKVISKGDIEELLEYHQEWEEIGNKTREIIQNDLAVVQGRIREIDEWIEKLMADCQGPARQMTFEKLMELWGTFNKTSFQETETKRRRLKDITVEYNKVIASSKKKLEPKELVLGIKESDLKETLYRLEVLFPDNACYFREVFDENGKINSVKLFEILMFLLPEINQQLAGFSVRSIESLKFEMKELSKIAVKSDSICHELSSLRRSFPFGDVKFQELSNPTDATGELSNDLGIRNKIFNTPPITLNFQEDAEIVNRITTKRNRIALLDDDQVHQMNLRMRLLSSSVCQQLPRTPRSSKKSKVATASPGNVFAVPKPSKKEKMNPLSMLNKITAHGKLKAKPPQPINSTMNISSLSTLGDISLRPEFSSTLLGTPEKQTSQNRRSINGIDQSTQSTFQPSPRFKTIYSEDLIGESSAKGAITPDSLFLLGQGKRISRRRSSLLQLDQMQTSPSGKLEPLVMKVKGVAPTMMTNVNVEMPEIRVSAPDSEEDKEASERMVDSEQLTDTADKDDLDRTLNQEENDTSVDMSHTLVAFGMSKLNLTSPDKLKRTNTAQSTVVPGQMVDEDLFNVSDGILTDFD